MGADDPQLLGPELGRDETQDAHAPRPTAQSPTRLLQECVDLRGPHQRQGEEREGPGAGDLGGELRAVADARHRALDDRVPRPVRQGQRRPLLQRPTPSRVAAMFADRLSHRGHDPPDRPEPSRQAGRERRILAECQEFLLGPPPAHAPAHGQAPGRPGLLRRSGLGRLRFEPTELVDQRQPRPRVGPERRPQRPAETGRFAAVARREAHCARRPPAATRERAGAGCRGPHRRHPPRRRRRPCAGRSPHGQKRY